MTSVSIISGAVARIEYLKEQVKASESLANEVEKLLEGLKAIKQQLIAVYKERREAAGEFGVLQKQAVQLSYEIVDAIADAADAAPKYRERFAALVRLNSTRRSGNTELGDLKQKLDDLQRSLDNEQSSTMASPSVAPALGDLDHLQQKAEQAEETIAALLNRLGKDLSDQSPDSSSVICIQGKSGMGKTTLAKKLFQDQQLRNNFKAFAWVSINHNFQIKRVLQSLLQQIDPKQKSDIKSMNQIELIREIFAVLENKKYLLVLDDMGAVEEEWQSIRLALPIAATSKVIITTSSEKVDPHMKAVICKIPGLVQSDILTIVNENSSFNPDSDFAKAISEAAGGSPLIAIILGKCFEAEAATSSEQQLVQELQPYIPHKGRPQVLKAGYKRLAPELKPCLLYLGQFPQGEDVQVEKLYTLLATEDLNMLPEESEKPQQSRRDILEELARKKLVEVQKDIVSESGTYKSCRLPDQVHEFCKLEGREEDLFEIVDFESKKELGPNTRRLAIYLSKYKDDKPNPLTSHETLKKIRSLLIFDTLESEQKSRWPSEISDLKEFSRVSVLNFDRIDFRARKGPKGLDKLRLLRYLSFRGCMLEELPSSLSKLIHLETLDLLVHADCNISIPNNILINMKEMVHLYLPMQYVCDGKSKLQLQGLERLETLVNFDTEACDIASLSQLKRLNILTVISKGHDDLKALVQHLDKREGTGTMLDHLSVEIKKFDRYSTGSISNLKELLQSQLLQSIHIEGQIGELAVEGTPAPHVAEIVLDGSELEHDPMNVLGMFQNLRNLVLKNDAVVTSEVVISAASKFPKLRSLKLHNLQYLTKLTIEEGAMPELLNLEIENCSSLQDQSIPEDVQIMLKKAQGNIWS